MFSGKRVNKDFAVQISTNKYIEKDLTKYCVVYPNQNYNSYRECDDDFMRIFISTFDPPVLVPVWLTGNIENVTSKISMKHLGEQYI